MTYTYSRAKAFSSHPQNESSDSPSKYYRYFYVIVYLRSRTRKTVVFFYPVKKDNQYYVY